MNKVRNIFSKKYISKYEQKINYLGPNNKLNVDNFLLSRLLITFAVLVLCLFIPKYGILLAIVLVPLFYFLYTNFLLDSKIKKRNDKLYDEAILFLSMLELSLKEVKDLKLALDIISNKLGNSIALTFKEVLGNNKYNNDLNEVFAKVIETIPNNDVKKALIDLKESEDYELSITNSLNDLKNKNIIIVRQSYQLKPITLLIVGIIFITIIVLLLFNIYDIVDFLNNLIA